MANLAVEGKLLSLLGASKGGKARAQQLTPAKRSKIATNAALKRWEAGKHKNVKISNRASKD